MRGFVLARVIVLTALVLSSAVELKALYMLQDHAHRLETILPQNAVRVAAGDHDYQVHVEYLEGCYLYEIDSKTGSSLIQLKNT